MPTTSSDKRKKDLKCTGCLKIKISAVKKDRKLSFFSIYERPTNFKLHFLSSQMVKMQNFAIIEIWSYFLS